MEKHIFDNSNLAESYSGVTTPLTGLKVAPFYGCTLVRPGDVAIDGVDRAILEGFITALGAEPAAFSAARECCGSYQMLAHPEEGIKRAAKVIASANRSDADALILSCPMCEYNLGTRQNDILATLGELRRVPTFYFTQLLGAALELDPELCRLDLNGPAAQALLIEKSYIAAATA